MAGKSPYIQERPRIKCLLEIINFCNILRLIRRIFNSPFSFAQFEGYGNAPTSASSVKKFFCYASFE